MTSYQDDMTATLAAHPLPHGAEQTALGSVGGALGVAQQIGGAFGGQLATAAREAFITGMNLGLRTGAIVALVGAAFALVVLPGQGLRRRRRSRATATSRAQARRSPGPSSPAR